MNIIVVFSYLLRIVLAIIAGYMAVKGIDGWGWFLFAVIITSTSFGSKDGEDKVDE